MRPRLLLALHAHLPWVRHPEHPRFYEEDWLFEAMEEVYLPLLDVFEGWVTDGVPARVTVSMSPPLLVMLQDRLLQSRFRAHLDRRSALWSEEATRARGSAERIWALAEGRRIAGVRAGYERRGGDLPRAFAGLASAGILELATAAGTHALLPAFSAFPRFVESQLSLSRSAFRQAFGDDPSTLWLPECGWSGEVEAALREAGFEATFLEWSGLAAGRPRPRFGVHRPAATPGGLMVLARDPGCAQAVWSREVGYPGDARYLDFHADETFARSDEALRPFVLPTGAVVPLGLRYRRVTDRGCPPERKAPYDPEAARVAAEGHAEHFVQSLLQRLGEAEAEVAPVAVAPFDAELFGHWWREGPMFLDAVIRRAADRIELVTPRDLLEAREPVEVVAPADGTWGEGGDARVWIAPETAKWWPRLLDAVDALERAPPPIDEDERRRLALWAREVALAASSDWPFLLRMGTAVDYAERRMEDHLSAAERLASGAPSEAERAAWEARGPTLPGVERPFVG